MVLYLVLNEFFANSLGTPFYVYYFETKYKIRGMILIFHFWYFIPFTSVSPQIFQQILKYDS